MKCDLCRCELLADRVLCDSCGQAVKRAIDAARRQEQQRVAQAQAQAAGRAAAA